MKKIILALTLSASVVGMGSAVSAGADGGVLGGTGLSAGAVAGGLVALGVLIIIVDEESATTTSTP